MSENLCLHFVFLHHSKIKVMCNVIPLSPHALPTVVQQIVLTYYKIQELPEVENKIKIKIKVINITAMFT